MPANFNAAQPVSHKMPCISLVGMPGVGKSTIGAALAQELDWAFVDSDFVIESLYGVPLQSVTDAMSKEEFLDVEMHVIASLRLFRSVIATGGSVVYRQKAMEHLQQLGPIVYLYAALPTIIERISHNPQRGIAIAPGQSIEDLFQERATLYKTYAQCSIAAESMDPEACAKAILHTLQQQKLIP